MIKKISFLIVLFVLIFSAYDVFAAINSTDATGSTRACLTSTTPGWIKVLSPNGGETYTAGDTIVVKWTTCNIPVSALMAVSVFTDFGNPSSPQGVAKMVDNTGSTTYILPETLPTGKNYKVRVNLGVMTPIMDFSDNSFIVNGSISPITNNNISQTSNEVEVSLGVTPADLKADLASVNCPMQNNLSEKNWNPIISCLIKRIKELQNSNVIPTTTTIPIISCSQGAVYDSKTGLPCDKKIVNLSSKSIPISTPTSIPRPVVSTTTVVPIEKPIITVTPTTTTSISVNDVAQTIPVIAATSTTEVTSDSTSSCVEKNIKEAPLRGTNPQGWYYRLGLDTSAHPEILKYRIQWFSGNWSKWYTPGVDDLDPTKNLDGSLRRVWSYFDDHNHEYVKCIS